VAAVRPPIASAGPGTAGGGAARGAARPAARWLGAAALALALPALAPPRPAPASPREAAGAAAFRIAPPARTVLKNGLTVLVLERRAIPLVHFRLLVKAGATADPSGKEGTAALAARLLKRGTKSRPATQLAEEVEFVGGEITSEALREYTIVAGEFASRDIEIAFNLLADIVLNPAFPEEELQKEKRLQIASLIGRRDEPERVAEEAFAGWLFGPHPYGRPIEGTETSVAAIARADVAAHYEAQFVAGNAVLVIAGDVDAAQAALKANRYFGSWKRRTAPGPRLPDAAAFRGRRILLIDKPDATQSQIRLGNLGPRRTDPGFFAARVANTLLGGSFTSLLSEEVRVKRGLTYSIRSEIDAGRAAGSASIATFSRNEAVLETIRAALEQVRRLRDGAFPPEALDKARSFLAGNFPLQIESPEGLAAAVLAIEFYGLEADYLNQYVRRVRAVDTDGVKKAAQRWFPVDDLAIVVVGPAAVLQRDLATLGTVTTRPL
jgi:predicted Zn-dependent peptidase